jgi:hypothetical protein
MGLRSESEARVFVAKSLCLMHEDGITLALLALLVLNLGV